MSGATICRFCEFIAPNTFILRLIKPSFCSDSDKNLCVKIPANERFEMDVRKTCAKRSKKIKRDGYLPFCVVATIGTTSSSSVDDVERIADICERNNLWLHVDTAYAGARRSFPNFKNISKAWSAPIRSSRTRTNGFSRRLICRFYMSRIWICSKKPFRSFAEYLKVNETVTNQMDYGIQLGRRFRSLKLWFVMRYFGQRRLD